MAIQALGSAAGTDSAQNALRKTGKSLQSILEQLASAKRINRASDDAAGLAVAEQLTAQVRGFKAASQNISDATAALDIAGGASNEITAMLQRQRELALQARNDTLGPRQREMLNTEYQAITQEINRIAEVTNYNGVQLTGGQGLGGGNAQVQVGPNAGEALSLPTIDYRASTLGVQGTAIDTSAGASNAIGQIDTALHTLNATRSTLGAMVNRLTSASDNLTIATTNTQAAESLIRDADMAVKLSELTKDQVLMEGAARTFSRYNQITQNHILGLLQ